MNKDDGAMRDSFYELNKCHCPVDIAVFNF